MQLTLFDDAWYDETFECTYSWANGDNDPVSLEQLARVLRAQRLGVTHWSVKPAVWFHVEQTRIEASHVIATCRVVPSPLGQRTAPDAETDDDDC